ncbi:molecular chaperone, partial [Salmonella enterica subsp. enterica serovar Typhimurium]
MAERNSVPHSDGVGTGATRVVYPSGSKHVTLSVNNTADHPFLVESVVLDESMQQEAPFIITPPLFRLDGGQRNTLRIMRTGGHFPADRESINWICVKPIPP